MLITPILMQISFKSRPSCTLHKVSLACSRQFLDNNTTKGVKLHSNQFAIQSPEVLQEVLHASVLYFAVRTRSFWNLGLRTAGSRRGFQRTGLSKGLRSSWCVELLQGAGLGHRETGFRWRDTGSGCGWVTTGAGAGGPSRAGGECSDVFFRWTLLRRSVVPLASTS